MLKIKDNVSLDELKKYGFKKDKFFGYILTKPKNRNFEKIIAFVNLDNRSIELNEDCKIVDDLIKADLVEKAGE